MLYDKHTSAKVEVPLQGLTAQDVQAFCKEMNIEFFSLGCPEDWDDKSVFRASTMEFPARGCTIPFTKVQEWKEATLTMGDRSTAGARYRHYKGGLYTAVFLAKEESTGQEVIVYRGADGQIWTRPYADFFRVIKHDGSLVARFSYVELQPI